MKLSIITINYNNKKGLHRTFQSVITQSVHDFEWIVIDGGSTDGGAELIEQYADYMSYRVCEPDHGVYEAMNKGIRQAHGEYLLFLNSGDWLYDVKVVENVLPLLKDADIYVGRINSIGKDNASMEEQCDFSPEGILHKLTFTWIPHQASFFKRSVFSEYGLYREDQSIVSDWWAYFRSVVIGNATIAPLPITIANYDTTGISATQRDKAIREQDHLLSEYPCIHSYYNFYKENFEIISALKSSKLFYLVFRCFFYIYRKFNSQ